MIMGPVSGPVDADQVLAAYPWPTDRRWVRAMMVTTLDGAAAGPDGLSGSISSGDDKAVFDAVRRLADVVLVGAGTIRAERYGPMRAKPADADARRALGQAPAPVLAIVSASLLLPWAEPMFTRSAVRPIVLTGQRPDPQRLREAREHADVVVLDGEVVHAAEVLDALEERGLRRVVCEGGPTLLDAITAAGLLDEADITVAPLFAGRQHTPMTHGLAEVVPFELAHVIAGEGFLMNRYVKAASA
jgi:riboflavin biosynthesis pyrimidine reductase